MAGVALGLTLGDVLQVLSGVVLVGLGGLVAFLRPRTTASKLFAAFCALYGLRPIVRSIGGNDVAVNLVAGTTQVVAALLLGGLLLRFPRRLSAAEGRTLVVPLVIAAAINVAGLAAFTTLTLRLGPRGDLSDFEFFGQFVVLGAQWAFLLVLAARFMLDVDPAARRQYFLLSLGLLLYPAYTAGFAFDQGLMVVAANFTAAAAVMVAWLLATARGGGRMARNAALAVPAVVLTGMCWEAFAPSIAQAKIPGAILRTVGVAIMAYAVLRASLFGIDLKVRWAISKSTLAAVFIAVFFVASEAAQQFFGEALGSQYVGILAAGALVFTFAPLSCLADRIAQNAVPVAGAPVGGGPGRRLAEQDHATTLAAAMRDGRITPEEEMALARLADQAGLNVATTTRIRQEALARSRDGRGKKGRAKE